MFANIPEQDNRVIMFEPILSPVFVENVGYNHFRYIKGIRYARKQPAFTIHFVLGGRGTLEIDGKSYALKSGDIFSCPPDQSFAYYPDPLDPWEYVWITASGMGVSEHISACGFSTQTPTKIGGMTDSIHQLLSKLVGYDIGDGTKAAYQSVAIFYALMAELYIERGIANSTRQLRQTHANRAAECIRQNFTNPDFRIEDIGRMIFVSHSYLCRAFDKNMGTTLIKYLTKCRMEYAKRQLVESDASIKDIAHDCGYEDIPHFCKTFLKKFELTPTEFRLSKR